MLISEEIKSVALAILELCLSEGICLLVNMNFFLKFHNYLMQEFRIDLKTFLGLATPN